MEKGKGKIMHRHSLASPVVMIPLTIVILPSKNVHWAYPKQTLSPHNSHEHDDDRKWANINMCCISDPICNRRHKLLLIIKSSCFPSINAPRPS